MKYEEWIQYEAKRQNQPNPTAWITLEPDLPSHKPLNPPAVSPDAEKNRVWTFIIQVVNSSRI